MYPYNKVTETESGHILEFDDTPNAKRIHLRHATGNSIEWTDNGNQINLIKKDDYKFTTGHSYHYIEGNSDITIDGHHKIYINKSSYIKQPLRYTSRTSASLNIQVDSGDVNVVTRVGKVNVNAGGDYNLKVGGNYTLSVDAHIARQSPAVVLKRSQVIIQRQVRQLI